MALHHLSINLLTSTRFIIALSAFHSISMDVALRSSSTVLQFRMSSNAAFLGEGHISKNINVIRGRNSQGRYDLLLHQLTDECLIHEPQTAQPPLVMFSLQRTIYRTLSNNSSSHQYLSIVTAFVSRVDSAHHHTLCMKGTKKRHNVTVLVWVLSLELSDEDLHRMISH